MAFQKTYEELCEIRNALYDKESGREVNNPKPVAVPTDLNRPLTLQEQIKRVIRTTMSQEAEEEGFETLEESMDFDVGGDNEVVSGYEFTEMHEEEMLDNLNSAPTESTTENDPQAGQEVQTEPEGSNPTE